MKTEDGDNESLHERQENELSALQAIFMDDFEDLRKKDAWKVARPPEVLLNLTPQESMGGKKDVHVRVHLHVKCGLNYPNEIPELLLENPKGISNKNIEELRQELINLAEELKGEVMIHELALHVQKYLHKHNKPQFESFYEEMLSNQRKREELNAKELQRQEEIEKQRKEQQRKALETEILKKQEALKEEARQRKENRQQQFIKSLSPEGGGSTTSSSLSSQSTIRRERSQSMETIIPSRQQTPTTKRRRQSTLKSDEYLENEIVCEHTGVTKIIFKNKGEKVIHRGKCLGHSNYGSVTFVGMDGNSGELVSVVEWILKDKFHAINTNENVKQIYIVEQELMSLMRLQHHSLVHYLGIRHSVEKDRIIVQVLKEHISGKSMSHHFMENRPVDIEKVRHYASELTNVLNFLHQNSVVHKDLRDNCIYIENSGHIKVADYSVGKRLSDLSSAINKIDYEDPFPPAIGRGAKKADIFRLGLLLLFLIRGKIEKEIPDIPSSLPNEAQDFLEKCLMKHEQDRWNIDQLCDHPFLKLPVKTIPSPQIIDELIDAKEKEEEADLKDIPFILSSENSQSRLQKEFQILKWLGKGGFGDVLKARNQLDGRIYAIKRIVLNLHNKQLNKKIMREVKLLSKLNHENIVRYYYSWIEMIYSSSISSNGETLSASSSLFTESEKSCRNLSVQNSEDEVERLAPPRIESSLEWSLSVEHSSQVNAEEDSSSDEEEEEEDVFGVSFFANSPETSDGIIFEGGSNQSGLAKDSSIQFTDKSTSSNVSSAKSSNWFQCMYIQMEFCEKSTLRNAIDKGLHNEPDRMWRFFREIVEGLAHIHQQGIMHRDLKPVNIFLDSSDHVKIGDFGLATTDIFARRNLLDAANTSLTDSKTNPDKDLSRSDHIDDGTFTGKVGTALYVAPELNNISVKTYTQKVDIYSLGIIFLEMCYHPLKTSMERVKILSNIRLPEIVFPSDFDENMSQQANIIRWLLNHDPAKRPTSQELLQSEYLPPPQMEEAELQEVLRRTINNPQSKIYKHMISTLLKQEMNEAAEYIYDMDIHKGSFNLKPILTHKHIRETLIKVFQKHGAINVITPLLVPKFQAFEQGDQCVSLMDHSGGVITLPFELRVSFARYVVRNNIANLKRYCISRVYRERKVFGCHPRELFECAFDIVSANPGSLIADAEVLTVVGDTIAEFQALQNRTYIFRLNHTSLVKAILIHSGVPELQHNEVISIIRENKLENMDKFQIDNHLSNLNLSDQTLSSLSSFLKMEGTISKISAQLKSVIKQRQQAASFAKQALAELEIIINNAVSLGLKDQTIVVTPGLMYSTHQFSGFFFKVVCELKRKHRKNCIDTLAAGGRYDKLLTSMRISSSASTGKEIHRSAVGVSIALEKIMSAILEDESFRPSSSFDVLVCSVGHQPMLKEKTNLIKDLWAAGIKASLHSDSSQALEEIQEICKDMGIPYIVIFKEGESGCRLRALEKDRFTEKKFNSIELPEYLQKCLACKLDTSDSSFAPLMRVDSNKSCFGADSTSGSFNNFNVTFVTLEKLAANSKRRYESQIASHVSSTVLQFISSKVCVEILAVDLDKKVLKNIASDIVLDNESDFKTSIKTIFDSNARHRKYLGIILDELHELKFPKKCPVIMLYGLKENYYKLLL